MAELEVARNCIYNVSARTRVNASLFVVGAIVGIQLLAMFARVVLRVPDQLLNPIEISAFGLMPVLIAGELKRIRCRRREFSDMLRPQLEDRYVVDLKAGPHVGISPGRKVRSYAGDHSWDVGFIIVDEGLTYYGDQCRFFLARSEIVKVRVRRSIELFGNPRLLLQFRHESGDMSWLAIDSRDGMSPTAQFAALHRLQAQIALMAEGERKPGFRLPPS
jgi:hypothetical protein